MQCLRPVSYTHLDVYKRQAVNTAMSAIDKIKDTSTSHERCSIIEVMGRNAGYIALWCQMANGADGILIPEKEAFNEQDLIDSIMHNRSKGKTHHVIINAEGVGHTNRLARRIEAATGIETRATVLGHIQRGGSPTALSLIHIFLGSRFSLNDRW